MRRCRLFILRRHAPLSNSAPFIFHPPATDSGPSATPATDDGRIRAARLRMAGYPAGATSRFLSKVTAVLPSDAKTTGMSYVESADGNPQSLTVRALVAQLRVRFTKTDIERSWTWLKEFAQFPRKYGGNLKDAWGGSTESRPGWMHCL